MATPVTIKNIGKMAQRFDNLGLIAVGATAVVDADVESVRKELRNDNDFIILPDSAAGTLPSGGGQDLSEIVTAHLDGLIASVADGTIITSAAQSWAKDDEGSAFAGWDDTNNRPFAIAAGRFRLTYQVYQDADSDQSNSRIEHGITVLHNGSPIAKGRATSEVDGSSNEVTAVFNGTKVIDMAINDTIEIQVDVTGTGVLDLDVAPLANGSGTWVQLEYLGETPA